MYILIVYVQHRGRNRGGRGGFSPPNFLKRGAEPPHLCSNCEFVFDSSNLRSISQLLNDKSIQYNIHKLHNIHDHCGSRNIILKASPPNCQFIPTPMMYSIIIVLLMFCYHNFLN